MSAELGNTYAERYSRDEVIGILDTMVNGLCDGTYKTQTHARLINKISKQLISYWKLKRFKDDRQVLDLLKEVESYGLDRLKASVYDGEINPTMGIFVCKCDYGMVEKGVELEVEALKPYKVEYARKSK
jgi:hypothetical protein